MSNNETEMESKKEDTQSENKGFGAGLRNRFSEFVLKMLNSGSAGLSHILSVLQIDVVINVTLINAPDLYCFVICQLLGVVTSHKNIQRIILQMSQ